MTRANTDFENFARLNSVNPALGQHASMNESIARPIGEFHETKSLFGAEPLDDPADGWPGRSLEAGLAEPGSGAECTRLSVLGIGVKLATPRIAEILMSQVGFLESDARLVRDDGARRPLAVGWSLVDVMRRGRFVSVPIRWPCIMQGSSAKDQYRWPILLPEPNYVATIS